MSFSFMFFVNSVLFGVGLAMDAFSVSMANGLNDPSMKKSKGAVIAGVFAGFQIAMPLIGWFCIHSIANAFSAFQKYIPWIALVLLLYIGGKMLLEGIRGSQTPEEEDDHLTLSVVTLIGQGIATSIDALSVGFTIADYTWLFALTEALIIGVVTFFICIVGIKIGKIFGTKLAGKASILGGVVLIAIGLEIWIQGVF